MTPLALTIGAESGSVRALQYLLAAAGFPMAHDGVFGDKTAQAVRDFQQSRGLPATGVVDTDTWARLAVWVAPGEQGDAVRALQVLLTSRGFGAAVSGTFDDRTSRALTEFRTGFGVFGDGAAAKTVTWQRLVLAQPLAAVVQAAVRVAAAGAAEAPPVGYREPHQPDGKRSAYVPLIAAADWDELGALARTHIDEAQQRVRELASPTASGRAGSVIRALRLYQGGSALNPAARDDWPAWRSAILDEAAGWGLDRTAIEAQLNSLERRPASQQLDDMQANLASVIGGRQEALLSYLASLTGALLALVVAEGNLAFQRLPPAEVSGPVNAALMALRSSEQALLTAFRGDSVAGYDPVAAAAAAERLGDAAKELLFGDGPTLCATAARAWTDQPTLDNGRFSLAAATLLGRAVCAVATAEYARWLVTLDYLWPQLGDWLAAVDEPFERSQPATAAIGDVLARPTDHTADDIRVEGSVGDVVVQRGSGIWVTQFSLDDGTGVLPIESPGEFRAVGLVSGVWATTVGTTDEERAAQGIAQFQPRSPGARPTSWTDFVRSQLRPAVDIPPAGTDVHWGWEPGNYGAVNAVTFGTWFARRTA